MFAYILFSSKVSRESWQECASVQKGGSHSPSVGSFQRSHLVPFSSCLLSCQTRKRDDCRILLDLTTLDMLITCTSTFGKTSSPRFHSSHAGWPAEYMVMLSRCIARWNVTYHQCARKELQNAVGGACKKTSMTSIKSARRIPRMD